jgi:membrane protein YdbS with pleckstrin-like domain
LVVQHLPLLLEGSDQLLTLVLGHQELLAILLVLLLDLHFANEIVLVLDLILYLGQVLGHGAIILFLKVVLLGVLGQLWRGKNVLDSVGNDEVLVGDEAVDRLLILLGDGRLGSVITAEFSN